MNILYLTNHLNIGGITSYVFSLSDGFKKKGFNIYVASSGGEWKDKFLEAGIKFIYVPMKTKKEISLNIVLSYLRLSSFIEKEKIDIVHSQTRTTQILGELLCRRRRAVHIYTCHGFYKRRILRRVFPCWGKKIIAISKSVKQHLIYDFKVKEEKIALIHHGIDLEKFKPISSEFRKNMRDKLNLQGGPFIGIIARLADVKGHLYLIDAMREVIKYFPQAKLIISGKGKMKDMLVRYTQESGMKENIIFISDIEPYCVLATLDLFVLPSQYEGLGLSLMEAMAAGLPVVASDTGGIKDFVHDGLNGILVKPQDTEDLSIKILDALKNKERMKLLGENAKNYIKDNFSQEKMLNRTQQVYQECL